MRAQELDLNEILDFEPDGGTLRFAGQRAVILDAVALGILRRELIETVGLTAARGVLTRFGYAHGWRTAETMKKEFPWDSEHEWRVAGGRLHRLSGMVTFEPVTRAPDEPRPFAEAIWKESYEAEQHLVLLGQSDEPVCWTLCGFASGYLSCCNGRPIYCVEERCRGKGDAVCTMVGKPKEEWDEAMAQTLSFYENECLDQALAKTADALKRTERRLKSRRRELSTAALAAQDDGGFIVRSEAMRKVLELARRGAKVESTVLVTGESGVGKEVMARFIHAESSRAGGPFVAINCGAVPEGLLESELFGHAKGAFTGATQDRPGLFEAANGGTLFLDEVGDVPVAMQVKLLRALQEREVRRVGENKARAVNVRVLAATNRDLAADVVSGRFRQDLFYRLRVIELKIPALRDRREDILPLARALLAEAAQRADRKCSGFTPAAAHRLYHHAWPGNVRELQNAVERAVALAEGSKIDIDDLPEDLRAPRVPAVIPGEAKPLEDVERDYILEVLRSTHGNRARAAEQLQIGTATLFRKLKQYEASGIRVDG